MIANNNKFDLLYNHVVKNKNINFDKFDYTNKKICYICQNGTSGYATAAKGYIYELISKKISTNIIYFNCNDEVKDDDDFHRYINSNNNQNLVSNVVIIHSTPDIWQGIIETAPYKKSSDSIIIGRTVWEFEKLLPEWVNYINNSQVDFVSVPTEWNKDSFIKSGVKKPIIVEPHIYVDYPYKKLGLTNLFKKSILLTKIEESFDFQNYYKFYCIGQIIERKGILDTIDVYCKSFNSLDKVLLIVKTFNKNYSDEESNKCLSKIRETISNYNHAPILFVNKQLNYDEMHTLHDISDCYIQLTKSEGFGLGIFDAFNKKKNIIVTGYGGHTSYLGKNYKNYVNYTLNNLKKDEEVFFQFKLNETYSWAIPDKNYASELLKNSVIDFKNFINFGDGFYPIETLEGISFKWMSEKNIIYINEDIDYLKLRIINNINDNICRILHNEEIISETNLNEGIQTIKIPVKNLNQIIIQSNYIIPSKSFDFSEDNRKLSCKLYELSIVIGEKEINVPLNKINYTNDIIKKINSEYNSVKEYVGDYGEMAIRIKDTNNIGKINLNIQTSFYSHRSGWNYVIHNLSEFNNPNGVEFDGFIENAFSWRKNQYVSEKIIPYKKQWIGFLHNPPNMPLWFSDNNSYPQTLINDEYFKESLNTCKGLYVLSEHYKKFLKHYIPHIPINVLYHPTEIPEIKFSFDKFYKNKNKNVVNIGWWLRKLNSIFLLNVNNYEKIRLMPNNKCKDTILRLTNIERDLFDIKLTEIQTLSVKIIDHLDNHDYDILLSQNIVFLDLYDTSANNAVIECIARGTPLLINKHPATMEYLGEDYPFYFNSLEEASEKLNNIDLINDTHQYLMTFDKRKQITIEYFKQQFKESEIYKSL